MRNQLNLSIEEIESTETPDFTNWFVGVSQGVAIGIIAVSIT
ncbi:daptide-type RiPP [Paenarthrobacter sp. NPDC089322]